MSSNKIQNLTDADFTKVTTTATTPVLVDFWAPWCGPCKAIAPVLDELAEELGDSVLITKVNIDDNRESASKHRIQAIPSLLIFKSGSVVEQIVGLTNKEELKKKLQAHI